MEEHGEHRALVRPGAAPGLWALGLRALGLWALGLRALGLRVLGLRVLGLRALGLWALGLWALGLAPAGAACRQALVLALDVSGSVDAAEYRLQLDGVASALREADVRAALLAMPDAPVHLAVIEWSGSGFQRLVLPWSALDGPAAIEAAAARLAATRRVAAPQATAIGAALGRAAGLLDAGPACWRRTVDISGDGKNNDWPEPETVRAGGALAGITVNALVVAPEGGIAELSAYFRAQVVQGPDAFVETALGYDDYARAMQRKLLREIATVAVGAVGAAGPTPHLPQPLQEPFFAIRRRGPPA